MPQIQLWIYIVSVVSLVISNLVIIRIYRAENRSLKSKLAAAENSVNLASTLTQIHSTQLDDYKKMVDLKEIEGYIEMKAQKMYFEIVDQHKDEFIEDIKKRYENLIHDKMFQQIEEQILFLYYLFEVVLKMPLEQRNIAVERNFKKGKLVIQEFFRILDAKKADTQKTQTE